MPQNKPDSFDRLPVSDDTRERLRELSLREPIALALLNMLSRGDHPIEALAGCFVESVEHSRRLIACAEERARWTLPTRVVLPTPDS